MQKEIDIKIVSDPVCPWCYIGLTRLNNAIADLEGQFAFEKTFISYQLHPWMPIEGMPQKQLLEMKYGTTATKNMSSNLKEAAKTEGLTINYGQIKKVPNTFLAHLLISEARKEEKAEQLYLELFKAFFERGEDIGNENILQRITNNIELNFSLKNLIKSETKKEEVRAEESQYRNMGVSAVPAYIINNKKLIEGAQNSEYFTTVFKSIKVA